MKTGVVITLHNHIDRFGYPCVQSVLKHTPEERLIIVIDNESTDPAAIALGRDVDQVIDGLWIREDDQWAAGGLTGSWNRGIRIAIEQNCTQVVLLNHDTIVNESWTTFLELIGTDDNAVWGPVSNAPGHTCRWQYAEEADPEASPRRAPQYNGFCHGYSVSCLLANMYDSDHFFNPNLPFGGNEVDWARRHKSRGGTIMIAPAVFVFHHKHGAWAKLPHQGTRAP